ncbi:hypothetical protein [Nocardia bovistercoris]|uniref:Uncharacterized protein n=1 Tax=Nocardia bovistercoris TaxID=2785916 RepID=A0A931IHW6_9NOCA|nr:hypothetical protein [Nocardia bovistercoris]MBH0781721.1 hypothetical protein [Nocardia bovistercoris]
MNATLLHFSIVVAVVFLVNLMPAFGPPNSLVLVMFRLNWQLDPIALVVAGALTSGAGRYVLAAATRRLRGHLGTRRQAGLQAANDYLTGHRGRSLAGLGLFLVSPLPSAQMFEAAGLMGIPLVPVTVAHVLGRLVSFTLYMSATGVAERNLDAELISTLTSPLGITLQIVLLIGVVLLARIDWTKYLPTANTNPQTTPENAVAHGKKLRCNGFNRRPGRCRETHSPG